MNLQFPGLAVRFRVVLDWVIRLLRRDFEVVVVVFTESCWELKLGELDDKNFGDSHLAG